MSDWPGKDGKMTSHSNYEQNYEQDLFHFLVQRFLLLTSQEAIFNRPQYFFHMKK